MTRSTETPKPNRRAAERGFARARVDGHLRQRLEQAFVTEPSFARLQRRHHANLKRQVGPAFGAGSITQSKARPGARRIGAQCDSPGPCCLEGPAGDEEKERHGEDERAHDHQTHRLGHPLRHAGPGHRSRRQSAATFTSPKRT